MSSSIRILLCLLLLLLFSMTSAKGDPDLQSSSSSVVLPNSNTILSADPVERQRMLEEAIRRAEEQDEEPDLSMDLHLGGAFKVRKEIRITLKRKVVPISVPFS